MASGKMKRVGAGWKKESQKGKSFMSVVINGGLGPDVHLTIWPNSYKEKDDQPDYCVYLSEPAEAKPEAKTESEFPEAANGSGDDDVPF
jgi:uncharacterized protein (DUF736 family)